MNLYFVQDRVNGIGLIVAAKNPLYAIKEMYLTGLDEIWTLETVCARLITSHIKEDAGIIAGVCLRGLNRTPRTSEFHKHRSPAYKARRREKKRRREAKREA